jgi:hypothetical protein
MSQTPRSWPGTASAPAGPAKRRNCCERPGLAPSDRPGDLLAYSRLSCHHRFYRRAGRRNLWVVDFALDGNCKRRQTGYYNVRAKWRISACSRLFLQIIGTPGCCDRFPGCFQRLSAYLPWRRGARCLYRAQYVWTERGPWCILKSRAAGLPYHRNYGAFAPGNGSEKGSAACPELYTATRETLARCLSARRGAGSARRCRGPG